MKVKINGVRSIRISGEFIKLDALLKYASVTSTGGEAKIRIQNGEVYVGAEMCRSRGKKIMPGNVVRCGDVILLVKQAEV